MAIATLDALLFSYDKGVISGTILFIKGDLSLSPTMEEVVVTAVLVGAGGALTGPFGRR